MLGAWLLLIASPALPLDVAPSHLTSFPDRLTAPAPMASRQMAGVALSTIAEIKLPPTYPYFADRVDRAQVHASQQFVTTNVSPKPEATAPSDWKTTSHPDWIARPQIAAASQVAVSLQPRPEIPAPPSFVSYPDKLDRALIHASQQLAPAALPQKPESAGPLAADATFDDFARHPWLSATEHPTFAFAPMPERNAPLFPVLFADRADRPFVHASRQWVTTELPPRIELTTPLDGQPVYPDRALRAWLPTAGHPYSVFSPAPERTLSPAFALFADRADRPVVHASQQFFATDLSARPEGEIENDWQPVYPDRALRPWLVTSAHPVLALAPLPERSTTFYGATFPDSAPRPSLGASLQLAATEVQPRPEGAQALDWAPVYPASAIRPWLSTAAQSTLAFAVTQERPTQIAISNFPDRADRPAMLAAQQWIVTEIPPVQEAPLPLPWQPNYPDRALRPFLPTASVPFSILSTVQERTSPTTYTLFPDRVDRPTLHASQQMAPAAAPRSPEAPLPLDWQPVYADRASHAWLTSSEQPTFTASMRPEGRVPLDWDPLFPDRAPRAWLASAAQPFATRGTSPLPDTRGQAAYVPDILFRVPQQPLGWSADVSWYRLVFPQASGRVISDTVQQLVVTYTKKSRG